MFEKRLKELNPSLPTISYDVSDLYAYLDTFADFTALVYVVSFPFLHVAAPFCGVFAPIVDLFDASFAGLIQPPRSTTPSPETG